MAMSRSRGATSFTTRSPIRISPSVISSSPAIIRSTVDFPQPDGPTSTSSSPCSISRSTPFTARRVFEYAFATFVSVTRGTGSRSGLDGGALPEAPPDEIHGDVEHEHHGRRGHEPQQLLLQHVRDP